MVVDLHKLNKVTQEDKFPLQNVNNILDILGNSKILSKIYLKSDYHQIEIDAKPHSLGKTGTTNFYVFCLGCETLPQLSHQVLNSLVNNICLVYLADIIILGKTVVEELKNLTVLEQLRQHRHKILLDNFKFFLEVIEYLGHIVTIHGIKPNHKLLEKKKEEFKGTITPKTN